MEPDRVKFVVGTAAAAVILILSALAPVITEYQPQYHTIFALLAILGAGWGVDVLFQRGGNGGGSQ